MGFFSRLFGKKDKEEAKVGGIEDYMTLVRVYMQAALAERLGITNLAMLPDLRAFKTTLKVHCKKELQEDTGPSALYVSIPGFHSRPDDADGESDEIQTSFAFFL